MSRFHTTCSMMISSLLLILSSNTFAQDQATTTETTTTSTTETANGPVTVQKHVITTTVPTAKEVIETPAGFVSCDTIPAGWQDTIWVPAHRVCKYENSNLGVAWIEGYWSCVKYKIDTGECTNWKWIDAHWVKTYSLY